MERIVFSDAYREHIGLSPHITRAAWAYPCPTAARGDDPISRFLTVGGFLYLDATDAVVTIVQALPGGQPPAFTFSGPYPLPPKAIGALEDAGRLHPVTAQSLLRLGVKDFAWLAAGEQYPGMLEANHSGAFAYRCRQSSQHCYFCCDASVPVRHPYGRSPGGLHTQVHTINLQRAIRLAEALRDVPVRDSPPATAVVDFNIHTEHDVFADYVKQVVDTVVHCLPSTADSPPSTWTRLQETAEELLAELDRRVAQDNQRTV